MFLKHQISIISEESFSFAKYIKNFESIIVFT